MLLWALCSFTLTAQVKSPGWLIMANGDTIRGELGNANLRSLGREIVIYPAGGVPQRYTPETARAFFASEIGLFEVYNATFFKSDDGLTSTDVRQPMFLKRIVDGPLKLYLLEVLEGDFFYIKSEKDSIVPLVNHYLQLDKLDMPNGFKLKGFKNASLQQFRTSKQGFTVIESTEGNYRHIASYQTTLRKAMIDCPKIKIAPDFRYDEHNLSKVIEQYNRCKGYVPPKTLAEKNKESWVGTGKSRVQLLAMMGGNEQGLIAAGGLSLTLKRNFRVHPELLVQYYFVNNNVAKPYNVGALIPRVGYDVVHKRHFVLRIMAGAEAYLIDKKGVIDHAKALKLHLGAGFEIPVNKWLSWHTETSYPRAPQVKTGILIRL